MAEGSRNGPENDVTCPICLQLYEDPKILPCGHTYCKDPCLTGLARQSDSNTITCPKCRKVAPSDVNTFPTVYNIVSLVDSYKADREAGKDKPDLSSNYCQQHEGQELVLYCETCSKTLCVDCTIDTTEHTEHCCGYNN